MIRQKVGQSLFAVSNKLRRIIYKEHQGTGVSGGQSRVLNFIYRQSEIDDVYQKDLEAFFSIRSSSATQLIQKLVENDLVKREVSSKDRRMKKLSLTDKGLKVVKKTFNLMDVIETTYKERVGKDNHEIFIELLHLFEETLDLKEESYV